METRPHEQVLVRPPAPPSRGGYSTPRPRKTRWLRYFVPLVVAIVLGVASGIGFAAAIHMPQVETLADFTPGLITQIYDREGQLFASFARQRRVMVQDIPPLIQNAVLSAEDSNFFQHGGVDALGILRAALSNMRSGRKAEGASTITMQLARRLFLNPDKRWSRKIEEAFLAVQIEKRFSKQQILALYCNLEFWGHGNYGIAAAARDYFNKDVRDLTLPEAATLAGIPQRPSEFSPFRNPESTTKRRNHVIDRMLAEGFINQPEHDAAIAQPLLVAQVKQKEQLGEFFGEEVRRHLEESQGAVALYDNGLQVRTTLDSAMQRTAERAVRDNLVRLDRRKGWRGATSHIDAQPLESQVLPSWQDWSAAPGSWVEGLVYSASDTTATVHIAERDYILDGRGYKWTGHRKASEILKRGDVAWFALETPEKGGEPFLALEQEPVLEGAALVLESATGAVRAMVGGWSFERTKFNRALQAKRQVGSAFKPFVFGAALEAGFTPADTLFDAPAVFLGADAQYSYSPRNYYRKYYGILTLRRAIELSVNVTTVKLLDLVGAKNAIDFAQRCGITEPLPPYPSLGLGSADISPIEMAAAYATFANQGVYVEPYFVDSVQTHDHRELESHAPRTHKAMEPAIAYVLSHMLEGVIDRGTAASASDLDVDLAGKTGTTDEYSDAWFIGYTPRYTVLTWVGYDQKRTIGKNMTGAEAALPAWKEIVGQGLADGWIAKGQRFVAPPGVEMVAIEPESGLLAAPGAPKIIQEAFLAGTQPTKAWEPRWDSILSLPWAQQRAFYIPREGERMPEQITNWSLVQQNWDDKNKAKR